MKRSDPIWRSDRRAPFVGRHRELVELREVIQSTGVVAIVGPAGSGKSRIVEELVTASARGGVIVVDPADDVTVEEIERVRSAHETTILVTRSVPEFALDRVITVPPLDPTATRALFQWWFEFHHPIDTPDCVELSEGQDALYARYPALIPDDAESFPFLRQLTSETEWAPPDASNREHPALTQVIAALNEIVESLTPIERSAIAALPHIANPSVVADLLGDTAARLNRLGHLGQQDGFVSVDPLLHSVCAPSDPSMLAKHDAIVLGEWRELPEAWSKRPRALAEIERNMPHLTKIHETGLSKDASAAMVERGVVAAFIAGHFLSDRGDSGHAIRTLEDSLAAAANHQVSPHATARALLELGRLERKGGQLKSDRLNRALELAEELGDTVLAAHVRYGLGVRAHELRDNERAREILQSCVDQTHSPRVHGMALTRLAAVLKESGVTGSLLRQALEHFLAEEDLYGEIIARMYLAMFEQFAGRVEIAEHETSMIAELNETYESRATAAIVDLTRARLVFGRGDLEESSVLFESALDSYRELGNRHGAGIAAMELANVQIEIEKEDEAHATIELAARLFAPLGQPDLMYAVDAIRARLDVALFDQTGGVSYLKRARQVHERLKHARLEDGKLSIAPLFSWMYRRLSHALDIDESKLSVTIASDGTWFQRVGEDRVSIANRRSLRGIVGELASRIDGEPASLDELLEAGWPGEMVSYESGRNRVYVAVSTLRKLGLEGVLVFDEERQGYLLESAVTECRPE